MTGFKKTKVSLLVILLLSLVFIINGNASAATYYVSPTGSDSNSGTSSAPFRSIQKAANIVNPGDTVIVRDGTYTDTNGDDFVVKIARGGTSSQPIIFRSENKWGAVLDGQNNAAGYGIVVVTGTSYINIENFEIKDVLQSGLFVGGTAHHITMTGNKIHDVGRKTFACDLALALYGKTGSASDAGSSYLTYDSNIFYNIGRLPGGCAQFDYNHDHGIYRKGNDTTIINNIFYDNKSGWSVLLDDGSRRHNIINNTFYGANPQKNGQIVFVGVMSDVIIQNNISHSPINYFIEPCCGTNAWTNDTNIVVKNNLVYNASVAGFTDPEYTFSGNITGQDPKFKSVTSRDFHLQAGSPAIDKGLDIPGYDYDADGNPIVGLPDLGAYEYTDGTAPPPPSDTTPPTVPTGLTATAISSTQINLAWTASTDNVGVTGYRVYRGTTLIATTTSRNYSNTGLTASTTYSYSVAAIDAAGNASAKSAAVSATTQAAPDTQAPTVPTGLTATAISSSQINLAWSASTDNVGVTGYKVYINGNLRATTTQPNYSDTGLQPTTTYTYAVAAFDGAGNTSVQTATVSATTHAAPDTQAPTVPTDLTATAISSTQINLAWSASTDNVGVTGYKVYRGTTLIASVTNTSYSNSGLAPSTTYSYSVAAIDAAGNASAKSAAVSATTQAAPDTQAPTVPTGLTATAVSSSQINLAWSASTDNVGVTGYKVYSGTTLIASVTNTSYSNTGLAPSTTYSYSVAAIDAAGNASAQSAAVSATTQVEPIPEAPMKLNSPNGGEVLPTGTVYEVQWDGPSHAATFDLSYSVDGGATWKSIVSSAVGKSYAWQVPAVKRNKKNCILKVVGYDAAKTKIGDDISDASFVVEAIRVTSPNGRQTLTTTGVDAHKINTVDITWVTYETKRPVASVKLKYTVNGGITWKLIDEVIGNPGSYAWQLPGAKKLKEKCRVAVVLKDADGKTVGIDGSDDYFSLEPESEIDERMSM